MKLFAMAFRARNTIWACAVAIALCAMPAMARDGRADFDFAIGTWKTKVKRLVKPLTGSKEWAEYEGTTVCSKIWNGRANLVELNVSGPTGRIEVLSLRLYNPESQQWNLNVASLRGGTLSPPVIGEFQEGKIGRAHV